MRSSLLSATRHTHGELLTFSDRAVFTARFVLILLLPRHTHGKASFLPTQLSLLRNLFILLVLLSLLFGGDAEG